MNGRRLLAFAMVAAFASLFACAPARAGTTPALRAFDAAFARVNDYTCQIRAHEVKGARVQDRIYDYSFMKPHYAKVLIDAGEGRGSGAVWLGGGTISGHRGGIFSFVHLRLALNDPAAVSLLGLTMTDTMMQSMAEQLEKLPGRLSQTPGGKIDGDETERVQLDVANPAATVPAGVKTMVVYFSAATHLPLRVILTDTDGKAILDDSYLDVKTNVGLSVNDFPF